MLYLEDYLELIEHLPQELRDRLTLIRENDLQVNNSSLHIDTKVNRFFAEAKELSPEQRQCEYGNILKDYEKSVNYADDKVQLASQTHDIMLKLVQRLDGELEKFKLELEADHAGITEQLERRSLELDADTRLDETIKSHLNGSYKSHHQHLNHHYPKHLTGFKDRRRSEHKHQHHRHHPYHNHHYNNGYQVRAKLSHNHGHNPFGDDDQAQHLTSKHNNNKQMPHYYYQNRQGNGRFVNHNVSDLSNTSSQAPYGSSANSAPASVAGDHMMNGRGGVMDCHGGHYGSNLTSFGSNPGFKSTHKNHNNNLPYNQQHSALSAALSSATILTPASNLTMIGSSIQNKISTSNGVKGGDPNDPNNSLIRQSPHAAASQAFAATQQEDYDFSSLKGSYAYIEAEFNNSHKDKKDHNNGAQARDALTPMAPNQLKYNQHYGRLSTNGNPSPLFISVTKSGRPSKKPKHHASHLYPDESPTSISSDNSVFENNESMSSVDFVDAGTTFGSASPSSYDHNNSSRVGDQGAGGGAFYQRDETKYCICRQISYGEMVACDNEECEIEWFHYGCVGITQTPKGKWFCPECTQDMNSHHQHQSTGHQTQVHKKRGRKEMLGN